MRDIEPEDLLGREPVQLDEAGIGATLHGKTVLITGAGGTSAASVARWRASNGTAGAVRAERVHMYSIEQDMSERFPQLALVG